MIGLDVLDEVLLEGRVLRQAKEAWAGRDDGRVLEPAATAEEEDEELSTCLASEDIEGRVPLVAALVVGPLNLDVPFLPLRNEKTTGEPPSRPI